MLGSALLLALSSSAALGGVSQGCWDYGSAFPDACYGGLPSYSFVLYNGICQEQFGCFLHGDVFASYAQCQNQCQNFLTGATNNNAAAQVNGFNTFSSVNTPQGNAVEQQTLNGQGLTLNAQNLPNFGQQQQQQQQVQQQQIQQQVQQQQVQQQQMQQQQQQQQQQQETVNAQGVLSRFQGVPINVQEQLRLNNNGEVIQRILSGQGIAVNGQPVLTPQNTFNNQNGLGQQSYSNGQSLINQMGGNILDNTVATQTAGNRRRGARGQVTGQGQLLINTQGQPQAFATLPYPNNQNLLIANRRINGNNNPFNFNNRFNTNSNLINTNSNPFNNNADYNTNTDAFINNNVNNANNFNNANNVNNNNEAIWTGSSAQYRFAVCSQESNQGNCGQLANFVRQFFFNSQTGVCEPFAYSGCGGNGNRFPNIQQCQQWCQAPFNAGPSNRVTNVVERVTVEESVAVAEVPQA